MISDNPSPTELEVLTTSPKILIVDASESDRSSYVRYLQADPEQTYYIIEAETLEEGLELWRSQQPDIVLLDINLPDGDGLAFLEAIGTEQLMNKLPVIVLTGHGDERIAVRAMKLGSADYLIKDDVTDVSLLTCIHQVQENNLLLHQLRRSQQQQSIIASIALHIRRSISFEQVANAIVQEIRRFLEADRTLIYRFNPDMSGTIVAEAVIPPWEPCLNAQVKDTCFQENLGGEYQKGKVFTATDIYKANLTACHIELLERFQIRANLVVPILLNDGNTLWGLLIAHQCSAPRQWLEADIQLLHQLSVHLSLALQQAELYQNLESINSSLEEKVQERTQALQLQNRVLEEIHDAVVTTDLNGAILSWNLGAEQSYGYAEAEVLGRNIAFLYEDSNILQTKVIANLLEKGRYATEIVVFSKSRQRIDVSLRLSVVKDEQGNITHLIGCANDITQRKRAEQDLQQLNQELEDRVEQRTAELQKLSNRLELALRSAAIGYWQWDCVNQITVWDARTCEIYGLPSEYINSITYEKWTSMLHPEDLASTETLLQQALSGEAEYEPEFRIVRPNGSIRFIKAYGIVIRDEQGNPTTIIGIHLDISDRKQAEAQLRQKNLELEELVKLREEALTLREDMSNMIIHDLRNPLLAMLLSAEIIKKYSDRPSTKAILIKKAEQILTSGKRLQNMIDSLLLMAKLESGKILFNPVPTDLYELGTAILNDFELFANTQKIELTGDLPNPKSSIVIDEIILHRVIENLLSNALKFSPSNSQVRLRIEYLPENHLRIQVIDQGPGVSPERTQDIFKKFEIGAVKANVSQIGLGLAFCKMAVEAQGGTLAIAPNQPQGSIFTVEI
jgi:PAS domain S-box-containing protein